MVMAMKKYPTDSTLRLVAGALADGFERRLSGEPPAANERAPAAKPKVYIADNSRLRPNADVERNEVEAICARYGLTAEWPSEHFLFPTGLTIADRTAAGIPINDMLPARVLHKSWRLLGDCDAIIADVSPFRGVHLNPVIAFEIGVAVVHEIPVFAWTTATCPAFFGAPPGTTRFLQLDDRVGTDPEVSPDGNWRDEDGNLVENFYMVECAQIAGNFTELLTSRANALAGASIYFERLAKYPSNPAGR
jgi:nucleoside 2-deoxyribosyltransferase